MFDQPIDFAAAAGVISELLDGTRQMSGRASNLSSLSKGIVQLAGVDMVFRSRCLVQRANGRGLDDLLTMLLDLEKRFEAVIVMEEISRGLAEFAEVSAERVYRVRGASGLSAHDTLLGLAVQSFVPLAWFRKYGDEPWVVRKFVDECRVSADDHLWLVDLAKREAIEAVKRVEAEGEDSSEVEVASMSSQGSRPDALAETPAESSRDERLDLVEVLLKGQSLQLFRRLRASKHPVYYRTLAEVEGAWRKQNPAAGTIAKALERLSGDLRDTEWTLSHSDVGADVAKVKLVDLRGG